LEAQSLQGVWENDRWGRAFAGLLNGKGGDFAWVQHMVTSMASYTGRMAVVLPQGALLRGGAGRIPAAGVDIPSLPEAIAEFKATQARVREAGTRLQRIMRIEGWLDQLISDPGRRE
jgi:hypothetical protein